MPPRINAITGFSSWATWAVQGFGDFNGDGTTDMIMRNFNTGDLHLYDIVNNQITNPLFLARSGWIAGSRASRPSTHPAHPISCCAASTLVNSRCTTSPAIT
jgi:hypothetical protein